MSFERHGKDVPAFFDCRGLSAETYRPSPTQRIPEASLLPDASVPCAPQASSLHRLSRVPAVPASPEPSAPTKVALFSLAGGVGKTTLATSIARILSGRSVQTVLVNCSPPVAVATCPPEKTPRLGPLSFVHAPNGDRVGSVTVIDVCPRALNREHVGGPAALWTKGATCQADLVLFDMPVTLDPASREVLLGADHIVIPLAPDLQSAASIGLLESLPQFQHRPRPQVHYVLNRYDDSSSFHREVRVRIETMLGGRLHLVAIREDRLVKEASACGKTIAEYAPEAAVLRDLHSVAEWVGRLRSRPPSIVPDMTSEAVA